MNSTQWLRRRHQWTAEERAIIFHKLDQWRLPFVDCKKRICNICPCCNEEIIHLDSFGFDVAHINAFSRGGTDTISDVLPLCRKCNGLMRQKAIYQYMSEIGRGDAYQVIMNIISNQMEIERHENEASFVEDDSTYIPSED